MVQSVDRAVSVLEFLSHEGWSGVTEVANGLNVHKSTAHRLLVTLKERGLVEQDVETERYRLGLGLVFLASTVRAELDVVRSAGPVCQRLHEQIALQFGDARPVLHVAIEIGWIYAMVFGRQTADGAFEIAHRGELFIHAGGVHGLAITVMRRLNPSACRMAGSTYARSCRSKKRRRLSSRCPAGTSS